MIIPKHNKLSSLQFIIMFLLLLLMYQSQRCVMDDGFKTQKIDEYKATLALCQESQDVRDEVKQEWCFNEIRSYNNNKIYGINHRTFYNPQIEQHIKEKMVHKIDRSLVMRNNGLNRNRLTKGHRACTEWQSKKQKYQFNIYNTISMFDDKKKSKPKYSINVLIPKLSQFKYEPNAKRKFCVTSNYYQNYFTTKIKNKNGRVQKLIKDEKRIQNIIKEQQIKLSISNIIKVHNKMGEAYPSRNINKMDRLRQRYSCSEVKDRSIHQSIDLNRKINKKLFSFIRKRNKIGQKIAIGTQQQYRRDEDESNKYIFKLPTNQVSHARQMHLIKKLLNLQKY